MSDPSQQGWGSWLYGVFDQAKKVTTSAVSSATTTVTNAVSPAPAAPASPASPAASPPLTGGKRKRRGTQKSKYKKRQRSRRIIRV